MVNKLRGCLPGGLLDGVEIGLCVERVWALELGRPEFKLQDLLLSCFTTLGKLSAAFFLPPKTLHMPT